MGLSTRNIMETVLRTEQLINGVRIDFIDGSNRYFGDYHRLRIEVRCRVAITAALFATAADAEGEARRARERLGEELTWTRHLERMGVASGELPAVREELMESFAASTYPYLRGPEFPARLLASELEQASKIRRSFRLVK